MIDQLIQGRRGAPAGTIVFFILGCALVAIAVAASAIDWAIFAILPFFLAVAVLRPRYRPLSFTLTRTAIEVHDPPESIPYDSIETIKAAKRPGDPSQGGPMHYPIAVIHEAGTLHIPPLLSVPSDDVFRFLLATFPESGSRNVNPRLEGYLQEQIDQFGEERVQSYRARHDLGRGQPGREVLVCLAFLLAGLVWIGLEAYFLGRRMPWGKREEVVWIAVGIIVAFMSGLFAFVFWMTNRSSVTVKGFKGWRESSLVISPLGIALIQGDLAGEMRWEELKDLRYRAGTSGIYQSNHAARRGISLHVAAAIIVVEDVYDRPLNLIYQQLRRYWRR
jgi:hypothetical protein